MEELLTHLRCACSLHFAHARPGLKSKSDSRGDKMKFKKLTPNLIVRNVEASLNFYRTVLGFQPGFTVPDQPPSVFGWFTSDAVRFSSTITKLSPKNIPLSAASPSAAASRCSSKSKESK